MTEPALFAIRASSLSIESTFWSSVVVHSPNGPSLNSEAIQTISL